MNLPNGVGNADSVHTNLVDGAVDGEEVDKVAAERVLGRETNLLALRLDVLDNLDGGVLDVCDVLAVAVLHEVAACADNHIHTIHTGCDGQLGVVHVTSYVCEDLGLEAEVADGLAVEARLLTGGGRGELDVVDTEFVECLGDLDLGGGVEEGVGELLALTESGLDNLELGDIAQEVADGSVRVAGVGARSLVGLEGAACSCQCLIRYCRAYIDGSGVRSYRKPEWSPLVWPLVPLTWPFSSGAGHMVTVGVRCE